MIHDIATAHIGRRRLMIGAASALALPSLAGCAEAAPQGFVPPGYKLVFGDDFTNADVGRINEQASGGGPGAPAWRSRYHQDRFTVINKEKQIYMDPDFKGTAQTALGVQPFAIHDGILTISANPADPMRVQPFIHHYAYTSGCITSELTHWQTYGYFEMRAELPRGKGFWPAFWLLAKDLKWPPEIDIMEGGGHRPHDVHIAEIIAGKGNTVAQWVTNLTDTTHGFHIYGLLWTPQTMIWYLDGKAIGSAPNRIDKDMFMLVNLAVGSHDANWIPDPDETTPFPGRMRIDYIRAYAKA